MELKSLKDIPTTFIFIRRAFVFIAIISFVSILGSIATSIYISNKFMDTLFVINSSGESHKLEVIKTDQDKSKYRKIEATNHIKRFHELFYEIDQFNYENQINQSLYLIGETGKDLYLTLKSKKHFSSLVANNLKHTLVIDSIKVNTNVYPYQGAFYGKVKVKRLDVINTYKSQINTLNAVFKISEVDRNMDNPHGLLIENYIAKVN